MDFLGFAFVVLIVVTQPALIEALFQTIARFTSALGDYAGEAVLNLKTILVGLFLGLSAGLALFEALWFLAFVPGEITPWWFWIYFLILGPLQFTVALWNHFAGATEVVEVPDPVTGNSVYDADGNALTERRMRARWMERVFAFASLSGLTKLSRPGIWYFAVATLFLVQGYHIINHAIDPIHGIAYTDKIHLTVLGIMSHIIHGLMMATVAFMLTGLILRGVRFVERSLTILATLGIRVAPGIIDENALQTLGGEIDVVDEEKVADVTKAAIMLPTISAFLFDLAMLGWPSQTIAWMTVVLLIANGITNFLLARTNKAANLEAEASRRMTYRVIHRVAMPVLISCMLIGVFLSNFPSGRHVIVMAGHYMYGLAYHAWWSWYEYLLIIVLLGIILRLSIFAWKKVNLKLAEIEAKPEEGRWTLRFVWVGKALVQVSTVMCVLGMLFCLFGTVQGARDAKPLQLARTERARVVGIEEPKFDIDEFENSGKVTVKVKTSSFSAGVVEFEDPSSMERDDYPGFVPMVIDTPLAERKHGRDSGTEHSVTFYVPRDRKVRFRIAMRNASICDQKVDGEAVPEPDQSYGLVETTPYYALGKDPVRKTESSESGLWARFCAWWSDLWTWDDDDDDRRPPRTVIVRSAPPSRPHHAAPRPKPCKVKPLKVVPGLRDEVAAARNR